LWKRPGGLEGGSIAGGRRPHRPEGGLGLSGSDAGQAGEAAPAS
jgi:hypothetical protein